MDEWMKNAYHNGWMERIGAIERRNQCVISWLSV